MKITGIKKQKRHNRYNIFVDGQCELSVSSKALAKFNLRQLDAQEIEPEELTELKSRVAFFECEESLLNFLQYRIRSEKEIISKLHANGCSPDIISNLVDKYQTLGYINDRDFAESYLLDLISHHPQGRYSLISKLRTKGICQGIIDNLVEKYLTDEKEAKIAEQALRRQKRRFDGYDAREKYNKAFALLQRKGFTYNVANEVVKKFIYLDYNN